ncbi:MAG: DinB family protein [Bryobacteraceae bacterium]
MSIQNELAGLFRRDLSRLIQQVEAFDDASQLWEKTEGVSNSAGNLALHLEGNLREYVGRQLGNVPYQRKRDEEFSGSAVPRAEMVRRLEGMRDVVVQTLSCLSDRGLNEAYPEDVLGIAWTTQQFLFHLLAHLNYHLGQIDYLRRFLTKNGAISLAGL